jgi:hypothetical protein
MEEEIVCNRCQTFSFFYNKYWISWDWKLKGRFGGGKERPIPGNVIFEESDTMWQVFLKSRSQRFHHYLPHLLLIACLLLPHGLNWINWWMISREPVENGKR